MAWVTPLVIGFVIVVAMIATAALIYVRKAATTNSSHVNSAKFPVNLTPVLFSGRGDPVKKNSSTTPTFREFQVCYLKDFNSIKELLPW